MSEFLHVEKIVVETSTQQLLLPHPTLLSSSCTNDKDGKKEQSSSTTGCHAIFAVVWENDDDNKHKEDGILSLEILLRSRLFVKRFPRKELEQDLSRLLSTGATTDTLSSEVDTPTVERLLKLLRRGGEPPAWSNEAMTSETNTTTDAFSTPTKKKKKTDDEQNSDGRIQVVFETQQENEEPSIKIQVLQRLPSGVVIKPWSTVLVASSSESESSIQNNNESMLYHFVERFVENHEALSQSFRKEQLNQEELQSAHDAWKDTALKLEGGWEKEKSVLLQNFLKLYQAKQEQCKKQQSQIEELQRTIESLKRDLECGSTASASARRTTAAAKKVALAECFKDLPDDLNANDEPYDAELVAKLAFGDDGSKSRSSSSRRRRPPKPSSKEAAVPANKRRKTLATESTTTTIMCKKQQTLPNKQSKTAIDNLKDDSSDDNDIWSDHDDRQKLAIDNSKSKNNANNKKSIPNWKLRAIQSIEDDSSTSNSVVGNDDDDDDGLVDKDLQEDIMAQLEAMKK